MLTEDQLISSLEIQIHQPELDCDKNCLAFLKLFLFNYSHLKAAGSLLCPLIEFYRCLHTSLHYHITKESARNITLSNSIDLFGSDKLQNTFENFQGWSGLNKIRSVIILINFQFMFLNLSGIIMMYNYSNVNSYIDKKKI